jgi:hypothetical protein
MRLELETSLLAPQETRFRGIKKACSGVLGRLCRRAINSADGVSPYHSITAILSVGTVLRSHRVPTEALRR